MNMLIQPGQEPGQDNQRIFSSILEHRRSNSSIKGAGKRMQLQSLIDRNGHQTALLGIT